MPQELHARLALALHNDVGERGGRSRCPQHKLGVHPVPLHAARGMRATVLQPNQPAAGEPATPRVPLLPTLSICQHQHIAQLR